jgi:myo-inositol-1(or 4)-monophosphatase
VTPADDSFRPETRVAIDAVRHAIELTREGIGAAGITSKGGRDLVTATDITVEDALRATVSHARGAPVLGEERGGEAPSDGRAYWVVDPICGTRNYASGVPLHCVNLALVEAGHVAIAVVGDASGREIHVAERGRGAWTLRGDAHYPLAASDGSRTIAVEDGKSSGARRERAARFIAAAIRADRWDFRSFGTTLALPYVAAGRISAYVLFHASSIHTAAGSLLVTEAGGSLSDIDGKPWTLRSDSIVAAADATLHQQLIELARSSSDAPQ